MIQIEEGLWLWSGLERTEDRHRVVQAHLAGLLGCAEADLKLGRDELGRPFVAYPATRLQFSLARRAGLVALAVSDGEAVGVDIELPDQGADSSSWQRTVAGDFFAHREKRWLDGLGAADRSASFFRLWTGKEAVLKALGLGIAQGMAQPDFSKIIVPRQPFTGDSAQVEAHGQLFRLRWWCPEIAGMRPVLCKAAQDS